MLGCWAENVDKESLKELCDTAKADAAAGSLSEAMMICRTTAGVNETIEKPDFVGFRRDRAIIGPVRF
jgi:hypothetical protein